MDLPPDAASAGEWHPLAGVMARPSSTVEKAKRAPVACRRCRRLRSKCKHENAVPPCFCCRKAGPTIAAECMFPPRGAKDEDREFRRPRTAHAHKSGGNRTSSSTTPPVPRADDAITSPAVSHATSSQIHTSHRDLLPPYDEVVQGCKVFCTSYFQLSFIPKAIFLERLAKDYESVSVFLLLSLLSVSARFTPSLVRRYRGGAKATEYFMSQAASLVPEEMYRPSLDRTQAFFLLGIAEWGNGDKDRSAMHMGIAVTMASILCLHREETYRLPADATADEVINSEMARRTFWSIESQNNLHSGYSTPYSFVLSDITTQLPCDEGDFAFGMIPRERAVLFGTQAAAANPSLVSTPNRSLFASLIQAHNLWGQVARRACRSEQELTGMTAKSWESKSEYRQLSNALHQWEQELPPRHRWSIRNLRGYRAESLDLAYLAIVMVLRLSNIVVRRIYLQDIIVALQGKSQVGDGAPSGFWENMSNELFENVLGIHEQIDAYLPLRSRGEGFPAIFVFCVYICGSLAAYLWKTPQLCPHLASRAETILYSSLNALTDLQYAWPMASKWQQALRKTTIPMAESSTQPRHADTSQERFENLTVGHYQQESSNHRPVEVPSGAIHDPPQHRLRPGPGSSTGRSTLANMPTAQTSANSHISVPHHLRQDALNQMPLFPSLGNGLPMDDFEAELTAFLQGEVQYEVWDDWDHQ